MNNETYIKFTKLANSHSKYMKSNRKAAPNSSALLLRSEFGGNIIPKLSALVNISRIRPDHCLLILPNFVLPSADST